MKSLTKHLGFSSGTLRFASEDILYDILGVRQGSVTPLGLFNDKDRKQLTGVLIDSNMVSFPDIKLLFHPLSNDYTTEITAKELELFLRSTGHKIHIMDFDQMKCIQLWEGPNTNKNL